MTKKLVNVSDLMPIGAPFVAFPTGIERVDVSGVPRNLLELKVRRPALARYRAAWEAAGAGDAVVSHLPRMTAAVADAMALRRRQRPHLAFSFNFTDLPSGADLTRFRRSLRSVDRFLVYSSFEQQRYPELFDLPAERFVRFDWTQDVPQVAEQNGPFEPGTYIVAIGGEGRDYTLLVEAARDLPHLRFVIIARPRNGVQDLPSNVTLMHDVPAPVTWRIGADSAFMVVPLKGPETCCGHITIVCGRQLGIPMLATHSVAIENYVDGVTLVSPSDVSAMKTSIEELWARREEARAEARARVPAEIERFRRDRWAAVLGDFAAHFLR